MPSWLIRCHLQHVFSLNLHCRSLTWSHIYVHMHSLNCVCGVTLCKWHVGTLGFLDCARWALWSHFMFLFWMSFHLKTAIHFHCLGDSVMFSCETPNRSCQCVLPNMQENLEAATQLLFNITAPLQKHDSATWRPPRKSICSLCRHKRLFSKVTETIVWVINQISVSIMILASHDHWAR